MHWNLVSETLPDDDKKVIFYACGKVEAGYFDAWQRSFIIGIEGAIGYDIADVTHWMPLPEPPDEA